MNSKRENKINEIIMIFLSIAMVFFVTYLTILNDQNIVLLFFEIIIIFSLAIFIHEMGHLTAFLIKGYSIKFLIIGPLLFKVEDNIRIKLKITPAIIGGTVYPGGKYIDDDAKFNDAVTDMKFILVSGPLFSLVICLIALIVLFYKGVNISFYLLFLTNIMVIYMSFTENFHAQGDIKVLSKLRKERESITPYIFNYTVFNGNANMYILNKMIDYIEKLIIKDGQDIIVTTHMNTLIDWLLIEKISIPRKIEEYIMFYIENPEKLNMANYIYKKNICILIHKLIYSEAILNNNIGLAEEYFRILTEKINILITFDLEYHIKRTEHILNINDNSYFFNDSKNIKPDAAYSMYNELKCYLMKEKILNNRILTK